jgi:hypothetical protein
MAADGATTWILTASPENHAATAGHGFTVIGCKERRRLIERMHAAAGVSA